MTALHPSMVWSLYMMAAVFFMNLLDSYTRERLYTIHPKDGTNIVPFEELVQAPKKNSKCKREL